MLHGIRSVMPQHGVALNRPAQPRRLALGALIALSGTLLWAPPVSAQSDGVAVGTQAVGTLPVAPLRAAINAAAYAPMPKGTALVIERYDDSREHDAIAAALSEAVGRVGDGGVTAMPLRMTFDVYVIRSGVPVLAKGLLGEPWRGPETRAGDRTPPGIDLTALRGRTDAAEGNVLHQREDSFAATLRLTVTVSDPTSGAYLWRGWADSSMNGLSRAQVVGLLADPLMATLGRTVADKAVRLRVPEEMGGPAAEPAEPAAEPR